MSRGPRTHMGRQLAKALAADYDHALLPDWPDPRGLIVAIESEAFDAGIRFVKEGDARAAVDFHDAALGAAWRRCEAALPDGDWVLELDGGGKPYVAWCFNLADNSDADEAEADTPTEALEALTTALEARRAVA